MALRRRLLSCASPVAQENHPSRTLCSAFGQPPKQNNPSNLSKCTFLKLDMEPESPKQPQGHNSNINRSNKFGFLKIFTFSGFPSSLHHHLDHPDPNFHKTVYGCASLLEFLTKHGIACDVPKLICFMTLQCVKNSDFLFVIDFSVKFKSLLTPNCYKALFDSLATTSLLPGMKHLYTEMLDVVSPGVHTFNTMVHAYSSHGYMVESNQFVCKMIQSGFAPNLSTFTSLIMGYSVTKDLEAALRVFHKNMVEHGCVPDSKCYEHLILGLCFTKKLGLAQRLLDQMQRQGLTPTWAVFDEIVICCCKLKKYGEAAQVVDHMISSGGYTPELIHCRTLICGLYEQGQRERADAVFHKLLQCGEYSDDDIAWTILIGGLRWKKGLAQEFSPLFQAMLLSECYLSPQTHFMLNQVLHRKARCA
ncbi:PREDICTED: pentatricopeptide repeat-containing protein At5g65560-like [Camelina sativa]|uniref:Pentatricopeptide repeat-containing protein At5g65560-like n=1 Tax=Camelina sativa TaxID=90675 RepID=A0ABM0VXR6_CAMSA|nr:PREDICTED: pentatricopeptide repeat-containing protein At5g65560-like [Camelina sativa]